MTLLYKRGVKVQFDSGTTRFDLSEDLNIDFNIQKDRSKHPNEYNVKITNLSPETRKALKQAGAVIRVFAGYDGELKLIAQGNIVRALTTWTGPDCVTAIDFLDGVLVLKQGDLTLSFKSGSSVSQVLQDIRQTLGVAMRTKSFDGSESFRSGYSYVGKPAKALDEVLRRAEARWSFQNGVLVVSGPGSKNQGPSFVIGPDSGLIGRVEEVETTVEREKIVRPKKSKQKKSEKQVKAPKAAKSTSPPEIRRFGYKVTSLLLPQVEPGDLVQLNTKDVKGNFEVDEVKHSGGARQSNMFTELVVYAL
jgi:hypothetical protein